MLLKLLSLPHKARKANLNKELQTFLEEEIKPRKMESDFNMEDFTKIRDAIAEGVDQDKFNKELEKLTPEQQDEFAVRIPQQYSILRESMPVNQSVDLFGIDEREPSDYEKNKFIRSVRVLQDPSHILDLMNSGLLTGTEVDAFNLYHPELAEQLRQAIVEKLAELKGKQDIKLDRHKNYILASLLGVARINPATLERLQNEYTGTKGTAPSSRSIDTPGANPTEIERVSQKG